MTRSGTGASRAAYACISISSWPSGVMPSRAAGPEITGTFPPGLKRDGDLDGGALSRRALDGDSPADGDSPIPEIAQSMTGLRGRRVEPLPVVVDFEDGLVAAPFEADPGGRRLRVS